LANCLRQCHIAQHVDEDAAATDHVARDKDDKPGTHNSQRQAAHIIGMSRRSVQ